ncbi:MAG: hypothetical protein SFY69_08970 [Planctomycetota bacterium]|nr:hypothetical protein [Planctomycetota bacterium]
MSEEPSTTFSPLEAGERLFLMQHLVSFMEMAQAADAEPREDEPDIDTPQVADRLLRWWRAQPEDARPDANELVWAVATGVGEYLREVAHLDWRLVTQGEDAYLALVADRGDTNLVLAIADSVAKRFDASEDDAICEYLSGLGEHVEGLLRGENDPPPEPLDAGLEALDEDDEDDRPAP